MYDLNLLQSILQSAGAGPSVLQQLCTLPFPFYGDPHLANYTLSVLLAATHANTEAIAILSCELSYQVKLNYFLFSKLELHNFFLISEK